MKGSDGDGEGRKSRKRATTIPDDFAPNDTNRRIAAEQGVDLNAVLPQFCDHHRAKGTTYKDWNLALNTWIRRERPTQPRQLAVVDDPALLPPVEESWMRRRR